ncbi:hypothetical protein VIBNISO65_1460060 [Vibrio nigripulchritudo SO65]|uniref:hypothetical protein n=1 Tax=Vibrio nigripulchritudo TaxID=28173 RepID=UPI0003B1FFFA|nr:hypothetical protein [Vibrio nigripulchritudo]CCN33250.1 hypothetical protein VIBNIAM115_1190037 [Vibrio nigripulchritudo AM115]CCN42292.1 hypothetical protein VIBNIFTn2_280060 [Vibrio nigripulchritudo FTn2]CCN65917.1 hypothetical protein VIBNIPon4_470060 [Vibrio nigripulchritudo POn4]CCN75925.1 hypothetical protein VIBNISO65_1460060 [Vibrio nigripulchritudo SO65]BDU40681.1 hypothetical protein TUMSATVNIG2_51500 [Vibrio nigripulchritudo]
MKESTPHIHYFFLDFMKDPLEELREIEELIQYRRIVLGHMAKQPCPAIKKRLIAETVP